ncbi:SRPBCC family protein [Streptomyces sp. HNM0574]|uniref:SRPBCC family protein n=1 Tax=Streptomyces sp. HNM0574 TaxID=2714954 RepID=UPI001469F377|nr:SRPBCC family protein [Streptomyces sp. HNM0574]NLU70223.1 SRPBCC family protein [Streptomyces sp. HNM0574]
MQADDYGTTGAGTRVELTVEVPVDRVWEAVSDPARHGEWSPECVHGAWLDGHTRAEPGARFEARNRFPHGLTTHVICVVTAAEAPHSFGWQVYAEDPDAEEPFALWHYALRPANDPGRTVVHQTFEHGPGDSGLRDLQRADPANAAAVLQQRLDQLRDNMTATLRGMESALRDGQGT